MWKAKILSKPLKQEKTGRSFCLPDHSKVRGMCCCRPAMVTPANDTSAIGSYAGSGNLGEL